MNVQLFLNERQFSDLQNEVRDGNLTKFESILKLLNDEKINDSFIKKNPKFCYKVIKLIPSVLEKLSSKDLANKVVKACADKGIFKQVKVDENIGFDCLKGNKSTTIKLDSDLITLRNDKLKEQYLHIVNSGPKSKDNLHHFDLKKYDYIVVNGLKTYFYESILSDKFNKANFKYILEMMQLATEINESQIINLCYQRILKILPELNDEELGFLLNNLLKFFDQKTQTEIEFSIMEMYAKRLNFRIILPESWIKDTKVIVYASDIKKVGELHILDGSKEIHKLFQKYCDAIKFTVDDEKNLGELLLTLLWISPETRNKIERVILETKRVDPTWGNVTAVLSYLNILQHILNSWRHFSSIKEIEFEKYYERTNSTEKFQEGFIAIKNYRGELLFYIDPSKIDESLNAIRNLVK